MSRRRNLVNEIMAEKGWVWVHRSAKMSPAKTKEIAGQIRLLEAIDKEETKESQKRERRARLKKAK